MATVKCRAKELDIVPRRSTASIEWYADDKPQYYCCGYVNAMNDEFLEVCKNCPDHIGRAQDDLDEYLSAERICKPTPKKPKVEYRQYFCPECGTKLVAYNWSGGIHYCHHCGQAIDWREEKNDSI